ncbi:serine/threonine-protein kinase N2-like [Conger conger]|uniref:serine/threonine-protein kinase N2-like n=1 Tax=Conger conger TaxID=82655 RepID=UPI002A5A1027|nr:serine/threonine-protein kinase N2-like [Conger conger]
MAAVGDLDVIDDQEGKEEKPLLVRMTLEDFICIAVLGCGSFGKVLLAEYKKTQKLFAIKAIKKRELVTNDNVNRLLCEQRILELVTRARHPFLNHMFACFQTELHTCFLLEYAAGGDLLTHSENGSMSEPRTLFYSACAVLGIEFLHSQNIAHRDIKLSNMLLDAEGYLKIADFGHCKENMGFRNYADSMTGTVEYLAPEMFTDKIYTRAVDWWALGVCIYEMLVGKTPFGTDDDRRTRYMIITARVVFPKFLSKEAVQIIQQLTFKEPRTRLGSGARGEEAVKNQCFFRDISWEDLLARRIRPPWVPTIMGRTDVSNFDPHFTVASPNLTPPVDPTTLTEEEQLLFESFDVPFFALRESDVSGTVSVVSG